MTDHNALIRSLYTIGAIQFGEYILKSGPSSPIYFNLRKIIAYPPLLRQIAASIWEKAQSYSFDLICGVPYTALPIATCISLDQNLPMVMRRKEKKDYGTKQMIEGVFKAGQSCLLIEDVITTGGSILETTQALEAVGLKVHPIIALVDRGRGEKAALCKNYSITSVFTATTIAETLQAAQLLSSQEQAILQHFFASEN